MAINKNGQWIQNEFNERSVPNGYTQLEYIESTSSNVNFDTGITWNNIDTNIILDIQCLQETNDSIVLIQRGESPTPTNWAGAWKTKWGAGSLVLFDVSCLQRVILNTFFTNTTMTTILNGESKTRDGGTANSGKFYIGTKSSYSTTYRLYSAKIKQNNQLIRDFVPVERDNDNVLGLFDKVNRVFYTNSGTGTFIAGNNYINPKNAKIYKETNALEANEIWEI